MAKLKAVFYARVSTAEEDQLKALPVQIEECRSVIQANGWELVDQYIDEGKSATRTKGRDEYQRLLSDMEGAKFDIVVAKAQDRLQRNTTDWGLFKDTLVVNGKRLYLYLDRKFFKPSEDALISGINAIFAEDYSRNLSKKLNRSHMTKMEKAKKGERIVVPNPRTYGYKHKKVNGEIVIDEAEAEVVREIYRLYLAGNGIRTIRQILAERGITNTEGREMQDTTIKNILKNTRYKGTCTMNTEHKDFETKRRIKNPPSEWVYLDDALPAIISKEDWKKAQQIREGRLEQYNVQGAIQTKGKRTGKGLFSGLVVCGCCGKHYWKRGGERGRKSYYACATRATYGKLTDKTSKNPTSTKGCDAPNISEDQLEALIKMLSVHIRVNRAELKKHVVKLLNQIIKTNGGDELGRIESQIQKLNLKKERLLDTLLDGIIDKAIFQKKADEIESQIKSLQESSLSFKKCAEDVQEARRILDNIDKELDRWIEDTDPATVEGREAYAKDTLTSLIQEIKVNTDDIEVKISMLDQPILIDLQLVESMVQCLTQTVTIETMDGTMIEAKIAI